MAITRAPTKISKSVQEVSNLSFDEDFNVNATENLVYNPTTCEIDRMVQPGDATAAKQDEIIAKFPFENYQYMGSQTSGNYVYYGFKQYKGTGWYVMRKDTTDDSAWAYAYGTSGWTTAWADPTILVYGDPPNE